MDNSNIVVYNVVNSVILSNSSFKTKSKFEYCKFDTGFKMTEIMRYMALKKTFGHKQKPERTKIRILAFTILSHYKLIVSISIFLEVNL